MVGIAQEYDSQVDLLIQEYLELQRRDPNHELLSLATIHGDRQGFDMVPDFHQRCLSENFGEEHITLYAMGYYYDAMRRSNLGMSYELPPKPKPKTKRSRHFDFSDRLEGSF